jgi:hypothetical protein
LVEINILILRDICEGKKYDILYYSL